MESVKYLDLKGDINLPKKAREGRPRVIDITTIDPLYESFLLQGDTIARQLSAPDLAVTVLYYINKKALQAFFDPKIKYFTFILKNKDDRHEISLDRCTIIDNVVQLRVSIPVGPERSQVFRADYKIKKNGVWKLDQNPLSNGPNNFPRRNEPGMIEKGDFMWARTVFENKAWSLKNNEVNEFDTVYLFFRGSDDIGDDFAGYTRPKRQEYW